MFVEGSLDLLSRDEHRELDLWTQDEVVGDKNVEEWHIATDSKIDYAMDVYEKT